MNQFPEISIIIPTVNRGNILLQTLQQLLIATQNISSEIIIINDNKTTNLAPDITNNPRIRSFLNPSQGAASARNYGAYHAASEIILFMDDDILVDKSDIETTISLHKIHKNTAFNFNWRYPQALQSSLTSYQFGRFLIHSNLISYEGWVRDLDWRSADDLIDVPKLAAFYFSISKTNFFSVNGFNESFTNQGVEDDELSFRLIKNGVKLQILKKRYVLHNEVDRQDLDARLIRIQSAAVNRKRAFNMGLSGYKIEYSFMKKWILKVLVQVNIVVVFFVKLIPNLKLLDFLYFRIVNILFAVAIYKGYEQNYE